MGSKGAISISPDPEGKRAAPVQARIFRSLFSRSFGRIEVLLTESHCC